MLPFKLVSKSTHAAWLTFVAILFGCALTLQSAKAADANPYAQNYKAQNSGNLRSLQTNPDTKIFVSNHKEEDNISMLENGYDMMGSSGFTGGDVSADLALQHGKAIKADTVLVYSKYGSSKTAASKMQAIRDALKNKGEVTEQDLKQDATQYQYYASYWAKLPEPRFGVHIIKLKQKGDPSQPEARQAEPGLKVIAVIKGSPAAQAPLLRGDVLLKLGDSELNTAEDLFAAVKRYAGQTVTVMLERGDAPMSAQVTLNK